MTGRNVLVVLLEDGFESSLRQAIAEREDGTPKVHVVAPASVGPLEWLATDEDAAPTEASVRGLEAEWSLAENAEVGSRAQVGSNTDNATHDGASAVLSDPLESRSAGRPQTRSKKGFVLAGVE